MHTLTINVNDSFYPHFKALIEGLAQSKKLEFSEKKAMHEFPKKLLIDSAQEVQKRALSAEARVASGDYVKEEAFWKSIDKHLEKYAN